MLKCDLRALLDENKVSKYSLVVACAKRAREITRRKGGLEITNFWGKLTYCSSKDATISEMFIV